MKILQGRGARKIYISTVWATGIKNWHNHILCRLSIAISQKMYKNTTEFHPRQVFNKVQESSLPYYKWFVREIITEFVTNLV